MPGARFIMSGSFDGLINVFRIKALIVFVGFGAVFTAAAAEPWTIESVMAGLRGLKHADTTFTETRHIAFLTKPIEMTGTFSYRAPQTFIKETFDPFPETVVVDANGIKIDQERQAHEGQSRTQFIAADAHPLVEGLVDSAKATMSGEKELLEARYELAIEGTKDDWKVRLVPREEALREKVDSILFIGVEDLIQSVEIREADGDWSVINLTYEKVERH